MMNLGLFLLHPQIRLSSPDNNPAAYLQEDQINLSIALQYTKIIYWVCSLMATIWLPPPPSHMPLPII